MIYYRFCYAIKITKLLLVVTIFNQVIRKKNKKQTRTTINIQLLFFEFKRNLNFQFKLVCPLINTNQRSIFFSSFITSILSSSLPIIENTVLINQRGFIMNNSMPRHSGIGGNRIHSTSSKSSV